LAGLYWFFIAPNLSPALWTYWEASYMNAYGAGTWALILFGLAVLLRLSLRMLRGARGAREWTQLVCLMPCALLLAAELAGWYPSIVRTRMFVRPCLLLLAVIQLEDLTARLKWPRPILDWALPVAAVALTVSAMVEQFRANAGEPFEDYAAAVDYLRTNVAPGDRLLVHASAREGFRLYAAMAGWNPPAMYGDTGWPCCRRADNLPPHSSTPQAVFDDLLRLVPAGFNGRVWLLYTSRPLHWEYTGLDEGNLWRNHLWDRGCPPGPYIELPNLAISPMKCAPANSP
jgi:hypothetical protein